MEHLWSKAVATNGNRSQTQNPLNRPNYLRIVADGCHQLRRMLHGKEGVDGSSPSEGSRKAPEIAALSRHDPCNRSNLTGHGSGYGTTKFAAAAGAEVVTLLKDARCRC